MSWCGVDSRRGARLHLVKREVYTEDPPCRDDGSPGPGTPGISFEHGLGACGHTGELTRRKVRGEEKGYVVPKCRTCERLEARSREKLTDEACQAAIWRLTAQRRRP